MKYVPNMSIMSATKILFKCQNPQKAKGNQFSVKQNNHLEFVYAA